MTQPWATQTHHQRMAMLKLLGAHPRRVSAIEGLHAGKHQRRLGILPVRSVQRLARV